MKFASIYLLTFDRYNSKRAPTSRNTREYRPRTMAVEEEMFPARSARSPLVLVGAVATAGVLVAGLVAFKKVRRRRRFFRRHTAALTRAHSCCSQGNSNLSQSLMRTRVVFQVRLRLSVLCLRRPAAHRASSHAGRDRSDHGWHLEHCGDAEVARPRSHEFARPSSFPPLRKCADCFTQPGEPGECCGTRLCGNPSRALEVRLPCVLHQGARQASNRRVCRHAPRVACLRVPSRPGSRDRWRDCAVRVHGK